MSVSVGKEGYYSLHDNKQCFKLSKMDASAKHLPAPLLLRQFNKAHQ